MFDDVKLEMGSDMMPGAWLALNSMGAVIGSGVIGVGEQWNGDKATTTELRVSPEVYGEIIRQSINSQPSNG